MKRKLIQPGVGTFLAGAAVGAGAVLFRYSRQSKDPDSLSDQKRVNRALDRALHQARKDASLPTGPGIRYVIFSDQHRGARNLADDFHQCEATYLGALDHYYAQDYSLILLGDIEELLEERVADVIRSYEYLYRSETPFHPDRYWRVYGNHDDAWAVESMVKEFLEPFFPALKVHGGLVLRVPRPGQSNAEIFLTHGHQGSLDSDVFPFLAKLVLPHYRDFQILTGWGRTSPSEDACLRGLYDTRLYRWARSQGPLLLIAGHTHRPVWSSLTHLEKLLWQIASLQSIPSEVRPQGWEAELAALKAEAQERQAKNPPCNDTLKTRSCYFNTGCCRFEDGDITGIEIDGREMRLVKWGLEGGALERTVFEAASLEELFTLLD